MASDLGLHCLLRPLFPNIKDKYVVTATSVFMSQILVVHMSSGVFI